MARDLSILTIGEGVETSEQLARLMELGCDAGQGYHIGRPMQAKAAGELIMAQIFEDDAQADKVMFRLTSS